MPLGLRVEDYVRDSTLRAKAGEMLRHTDEAHPGDWTNWKESYRDGNVLSSTADECRPDHPPTLGPEKRLLC